MIDIYINIDKSHKGFDEALCRSWVKKWVLKNITHQEKYN